MKSAQGPIEWVQVARTRQGQLRIFNISSAEDAQWFSETKDSPHFYKEGRLKDITSAELRPAIKISQESPISSTRSSMSTISQFSMASGSQRASISAEDRRELRERLKQLAPPQPEERRHSAPELAIPTEVQASQHQLTLDTEGFFEDEEIAKYLKKNEVRGMEDAVRQALDKYDPNRPSHTGLGGMPTTKIILTGAAGGSGDYRLGFKIVGATHRPLAIMTHGPKGAKYEAIRK